MSIQAGLDFIVSMLLIACRIAPIFMAFPLQPAISLPARIRFFLIIAIALVLTPFVIISEIRISSSYELITIMAKELVVGITLSAVVMAAMSVFLVAGRLIDFQMGLGAATLLNPQSNTQNSLIGTLLTLLGTTIFFLMNGHHALLKGIIETLNIVPIGSSIHPNGLLDAFIASGMMFMYGAILAAPILLGLLLVDLVIAVFARTMPQVNPYFVGLPLKIFLGLFILTASLSYLISPITAVFEKIFGYWGQMLVP
ncbi:flagellar biosynthetic protein FliR [Microbulbifer sp. GL-2]|uniref:flagellar biosynthetic protein FliR n=1 Tax=Microbulbifer sp. GL-2 TaxID=2591606 RepID=UPI00116582D7|nr:flagellar biosynthetic protein FliR [Microbulbifer sp. GL-2]BBM00360.1 flagellar biosynthetic protein FliR [Microbulbifer sp. GL-2]